MKGRSKVKALGRSFYARPAEIVAKELLGAIIVHKRKNHILRARIVEAEAYIGSHDLACHASKGKTKRTELMFCPAGHAYIYFIYGMYDMFNIVTSKIGDPQAVLIRAAEMENSKPRDLAGPGKFTKRMKISRLLNKEDLCGSRLYLLPGITPERIVTTTRIGVDYSQEWKEAPLRFYDAHSQAVSKR